MKKYMVHWTTGDVAGVSNVDADGFAVENGVLAFVNDADDYLELWSLANVITWKEVSR